MIGDQAADGGTDGGSLELGRHRVMQSRRLPAHWLVEPLPAGSRMKKGQRMGMTHEPRVSVRWRRRYEKGILSIRKYKEYTYACRWGRRHQIRI